MSRPRKLFVEPYPGTFLPPGSLWATGTLVPLVEPAAGAVVILGLRIREALIALGFVLVLVTFEHLLKEPFYEFPPMSFPRLALLLFVLILPREDDRFSLDHWLKSRQAAGSAKNRPSA